MCSPSPPSLYRTPVTLPVASSVINDVTSQLVSTETCNSTGGGRKPKGRARAGVIVGNGGLEKLSWQRQVYRHRHTTTYFSGHASLEKRARPG